MKKTATPKTEMPANQRVSLIAMLISIAISNVLAFVYVAPYA